MNIKRKKFEMANFTKKHFGDFESLGFEFEQNYQTSIVEKHWIEIAIWIIWFFAVEICGNLILFATFAYEKYGMDPKKRTILNQLLSQSSFIVIFLNILVLPPVLWKFLIGPLHPLLAKFVMKNLLLLVHMYSVTATEIMVFKCLFLWKWSWMVTRNENFYSLFAFLFNLLISSLLVLQNVLLDDGSCSENIKRLSHQVDTQIDSKLCTMSFKM